MFDYTVLQEFAETHGVDYNALCESVLRAAAPQAVQPAVPMDMRLVPAEFVRGFGDLAHNYSLAAVAPDYYHGVERDAFSAAYKRCGNDLAKLREILTAAPAHPAEGVHCSVCGADEAFTGTCGGGRSNPRALCFERAALAATQPAAQRLDEQDAECLEIGRELCRACAELPWGYEIILYLEQGAGTVHWMDKDGNEHDIGEDGVFSEKIGYAIAAAQAKQGGA